MAQQSATPNSPWMPTGQSTGSPWEQNMQARLGQGTPEDAALQQRMYAAQAQAGQGPQFQGLGRPDWQTANPLESIRRANEVAGISQGVSPMGPAQAQAMPGQEQGALIRGVGDAMGKSIPGSPDGGAAARKAGYYASTPG